MDSIANLVLLLSTCAAVCAGANTTKPKGMTTRMTVNHTSTKLHNGSVTDTNDVIGTTALSSETQTIDHGETRTAHISGITKVLATDASLTSASTVVNSTPSTAVSTPADNSSESSTMSPSNGIGNSFFAVLATDASLTAATAVVNSTPSTAASTPAGNSSASSTTSPSNGTVTTTLAASTTAKVTAAPAANATSAAPAQVSTAAGMGKANTSNGTAAAKNSPVTGKPAVSPATTVPTTPKAIFCVTGTCSGIQECINLLGNTSCHGVCTKTVKNDNGTYGDYDVGCDTTYNTCAKFKDANVKAKTNPVPDCCAESYCMKYSPSGSSALNTSSKFIVFLVVTAFLRKTLLQVACP